MSAINPRQHKDIFSLRGHSLAVVLLVLAGLWLAAPQALGSPITADTRAGLAAGNAGAGDITFGSYPGVTFGASPTTFPDISVTAPNKIVRGSTVSNFQSTIATTADELIALLSPSSPGNLPAVLDSQFQAIALGSVTGMSSTTLSFIQGNGTRTVPSTNIIANLEMGKWFSVAATGSGFGITNTRIGNVDINYTVTITGTPGGVVNSFIGSNYGVSGAIGFGDITGNDFHAIHITMTNDSATANYFAGGGILGLRSTGTPVLGDHSVTASQISGNMFRDLSVTTIATGLNESFYIEGGGIIGLDAVSTPDRRTGNATLADLNNNIFYNITVDSGDFLMGGGIIGLNNNSTTNDVNTTVYIGNIIGNIFGSGDADVADGGINVISEYSLRGGGIIGLNALTNSDTRIDTLKDNFFGGLTVEAGTYIRGGGIVGMQTNDDGEDTGYTPGLPCVFDCVVSSYISSVEGNVFYNIDVKAGVIVSSDPAYDGGDIIGGAIIGIRSNRGASRIFSIDGNIFSEVSIETTATSNANANQHGDILGGGVIGISSAVSGTITYIANNYFDQIDQQVAGQIIGGGVLGIYASTAGFGGDNASIAFIDNNWFMNSETTVAGGITGGGVIGATIHSTGSQTLSSLASYDRIADNHFVSLDITANSITGGGLVGLVGLGAIDNVLLISYNNNVLRDIDIVTTGATGTARQILGGGVIGTYSANGLSYIGEIGDSSFTGLRVTAGTYIDGGGIIGTTGAVVGPQDTLSGIEQIVNSTFEGNTIIANSGQIMGGIIYAYGLGLPMTITDSTFQNNNFTSTVIASDYSGTTPAAKVYGTVTIDTGIENMNPYTPYNTLILRATNGHTTLFSDNMKHDADGNNPNSIYFGNVLGMNFNTNIIDTVIDPPSSDAMLIINAESGGIVRLDDPIEVDQRDPTPVTPERPRTFGMEVSGGGEFIWGGENILRVGNYVASYHKVPNEINLRSGSTTTLQPGMMVQSLGYDDDNVLTASIGHAFTLEPGALLNIHGRDNANNPDRIYVPYATFQGRMHFFVDQATFNDEDEYLLDLRPLGTGVNAANIQGATVTIEDFATDPGLSPGDMYYLINTGELSTDEDMLEGDPANDHYMVRAGSFRDYNFIIDKNDMETLSDGTASNKYLVARLLNIAPAKTTKIILEGVNAGLAYMAHTGGWLADHSFQQADLAIREENAWNFFAGFDVSRFWVDSYGDIDITGYTWLAGFSNKTTHAVGSLLIGAFLEGSYSSYDITGDFATIARPEVDGHGHIRYTGVGVLARQHFDNNLRIEGAIRGGQLRNHFQSNNYMTNGVNVGYDLETNYYAAHLGLGYETALTDVTSLDFIVRGYWARQVGKDLALNTGEVVLLDDANSYRARGGTRLTHAVTPNFSVYGGAYYEHEFDNKTSATADNYIFEDPELTGGVGIFEIGAIGHANSNDRLSVEFGLQGYAGHFKGLSGGVRVGYDF
ncbi:MAG: autotransporter outer membrane beta-barrel domain-containing protein [Deltaproteobacteria bacterium]|jgi:hypothetical protein|nr:autotransporter outer membrane beta-barrel domain-containing protein [Deltaproteobacteria bacterium]